MQSRKFSFIESLINVMIGFSINVVAQAIVFPWFGIHIPLHTNLAIGGVFTIISIARSYLIRRAFNAYHAKHG